VEAARPATADDRDRLIVLATEAIAELAPMRGGEVWSRREARPQPVDDSIDAALASSVPGGNGLVVVGTVDGAVIGYGIVRAEVLRDGALLGVIEDLYVEDEARGIGVGEAMMDRIIAWATEQGCIGVDALALPGNRATKNFFETFGLVARAILVHRRLDGQGEP
jgi:GNAT superfamily N-acetyltransferase